MPFTLQWPYRESRDGIWTPQTSTLNWCEEDYNITPYCAEFINTATNLIFMYLGIMGIRDCLRYAHDHVFIVLYLGYMIVGLGSMAFHATLKYSMQLADELPMIYTTCIMAFVTFSYSRNKRESVLIGLALASLATFITVYYHMSQNPVFHQVAYASLTCATVFRGMYVMETLLRPALRERCDTPAHADQILKQMWSMAVTGIAYFLLGFFIWNMDNIICGYLRDVRNTILLPWAVVLEGHGWWHIFTGIGAYYFIVWRVWLTQCLDGNEHKFMLQWPSALTSVPKVVPRPGYVPKANSNGHAKGNAKRKSRSTKKVL